MSVAEEYGFNFEEETCIQAPFSRYPCRKCLPCLLHRQKAWVSRLTEELRAHDYNYFVTLTYDEDNVPVDAYGQYTFCREHIIKLNRDLRKRFQQGRFLNPEYDNILGSPKYFELEKETKYKYYITSEFGPGGTHRPHYHGVWYGMPRDSYLVELLFKSVWTRGFVSVFPAQEGAAGYISKYLVTDGVGKQSYTDDTLQSPFAFISKGLGLSYVERMRDYHRSDPLHRMYYQYRGSRGTLDRYLKSKIFDDSDLEFVVDEFTRKHNEVRLKYAYFQSDNPELYKRLIAERVKYFEDMADSIRWKTLKHHKL